MAVQSLRDDCLYVISNPGNQEIRTKQFKKVQKRNLVGGHRIFSGSFRAIAAFTLISFLSQQCLFAQQSGQPTVQNDTGQLTPVITPDQYQAKTQQAAQQNQSAFTPDQTPSLQNFIAPDSPLQPVQPSRFVSGRQEIYPDYNAASDSVTNMPAGPDVVLVGGSSSGTKLVRADEKGAVIDYDVTRRYSWSGITFKYDDYGTRNIETADLSAMPALRFAILTDAGSLKMEVEDGSGVRDTIDLVNATGLAGVERIYEIRRDQLSARLDWTRIRFINFVIDQEHAITGKFQGRLAVRAGGFDSPYQYPVAPTNLASYIYDPMPGNPRAEVTGGSTGGTRVTAIDANTRLLAYNVTPTGSWSGVSYYYDNFSTSKIETYDFSNSPFIAAAVKGDATNVQLEIEDAKGKRVNLLLENLNSTEETVYQIDLSKIASKIDISQVRFVNFVVSQNTVAVDKRTGNLTVRFGQFTQDTTAPLVVATSAALTNNPDYLLTYTVDGVAKTRTETLVEGVNTLTITEQDAAGNVTNQTFNVTLDTKSPEVIVASSNITNKSNYVLSYTADGVLVTKPVTLAEGDNILNISARDAIGNETKTSFKVTLDTKAPVVVATSAALTNKLDYLLTYTVDGVTKTRPVTLTEGLNTLQIAEQDLAGNQTNLNFDVTLDTKAPEIKFSSATLTNNPSYTLTYTTDGQQMTKPVTLVEGENTLDVVERDLAGNETKTNLKVTLDTVAPSITFQSPDLVNRPDYQLIYQVDGATKLMLFTLTEGKNALSLTERDLAGNEVTASLEVLLDTTAPDVKFSSTTLTNKSDYTLTYSSDGIQKTQAVTLVEGDNVLDVIERDLAGNETKTSLKVMLDTIAPVVAATSVALTNNPDYTLSYTVDGVTKTRPLTLTEGLNTLQIAEQDLAGNKTKTSLSVTLDTKAPEIIFSSPILVNKSDYTLTYTTDGQQVTRPVTLVEGDNVLDVVERDLAGNETKTSLKVTLDTIAPVVVATSVALTNKPDYTVSYTVDGVTKTRPVTLTEGLNTLQIAEQDLASNQTKLNFDVTLDTIAPEVIFSSPTLTNNPSYTLTYTTDGQQVTKPVTLVERDNFLDVVERDLAGNETNTSLKVTLDTIAPEIKFSSVTLTNNPDYTLIYTTDGQQVTKPVTLVERDNVLDVTERDLAGNEMKTSLKVTLDTIVPEIIFSSATLTNIPSYTLIYATEGQQVTRSVTLVEGDNTLDVVERDPAGNETKTNLKVTLDTIAPEVIFSSPILTNNPSYVLTYTTDGQQVTKPVTLVEGDNVIDVTERDLAGNETKTNLKVTLDTIAPEVIFSSPTLTNNPSYTLTYTTDGQQVTKPVTLVERDNFLDVVERDLAGNETKTSLKVTLDTIAPEIIFSSPTLVNKPDYTLTYTADGQQVTRPVTLGEGDNTLDATERDAAGNETKTLLKVTLDTIAPEIKFSSVTLTNKPDYTLTYTSDGAQKTQAVTLVEGENTLEVVERDLAGNETKTNLKVTLDTIAPEVIFSSPTLTNKPDYTLAYTSDGVSISKNVTLVEGDNVLDVVERDLAGNETKTLLKVTLDTIAPEIKFSSVTLTNNPDYTLIYTTDGQRVTKPVTLVEGDNVLDVTERDLAGNETKTNLKVTLDTIPPQLEVTSSPLSRIANFDLTFTKDGAAVTKPVTLVEGGNVIPIVEQDAAGNETKIDTSIYYAQDLPNFLDQAIQTPQIAKPLKIDINTPGLLSVSIADGSKILYENGAIHHIELADGSFVQNVTLDLDGKIQNAELFLVNGLIQVAQNGSLAYQFTPAGVLQQFDTSGRVIRESQNGEVREFVYSGDHIWSVIKTEIGRYDAAGKLKVLITPSGYELKDIPDSLTVTNADGAQINVVGGLVSKVTKDGQDKNFSYTESGGVITRTQVSENGVTSAYSANGKLTTVQTADGTYTIENEKIKTLELKDGSKILDIDLDDQGNILKATILDLDGAYRTFENGLLVRMISPNGDIWIYANGKPEKLTTRLNLEYQFTYEPNQIKADLINVDIAKADTPIELVYDPNFKLEWMKKKNDILFKYEPAGVFVYDPANPDTETILDDAGNIDKVFIHASITNPVETEIRYRYGKPREIYENGVLTQKYSYEYLSDGTEIVIIESVAKNLIERYQDGVLQSSFDPITEVLTTFAYGTGGKKTLAVKSRQGQEIERYEYTYLADKTVARDKSGKISEFDPVTEKILREIVTDEKGNISTFEYTHTKNDFLPNENPFELSALSSQPSAKSFDIAGYPNADFFAHDGLYLYYRDKTSGEIHRLGPDFDYVDASGQVKPLDTVITANVPIPQSPFKDKEDEFKQMYPDAKFVFADGSFVFIIKDSEVLVYRQKEGDMVRGWTIQSPANFEQVFYDWIHNEIWIKKENENVFRRLGGLRDLDGHETSRRELSEIVTTDGTKVRYHDGKVEEITKPDGLRVRNLVTDEAGNVVFAKYFNTDGSTEEIQGHTSIEIPQPDFSKKIYTRGKLEKWILVDGREIVYTYEATAAAEKTFAKLGDWTYEYDEKGQLLAVSYQPSAKSKKEYAAIQEPGGRVIISNRDAVCDDCSAEKITFGADRQIEEYENLRTHAKVYFKNGDLVRIEENNQTTNFELGEIVGLDYEQNTSATEGFQASVLVGADPRGTTYARVKQPVTVSYPNGGYHFTITNQGVIDLNGDAIDDKVTVDSINYPGVWKVEFGKSDGTFQSAIDWGPVENIQYRIGAQGRLAGWAMEISDMDIGGYTTMLVDVNGDRLPDRVETMGKTTNDFKFESQGIFRVQFNNGHGFDNPVDWSNIDTIIPASQAGSQIYFALEGDKNSKTTVAFRDINGDGLVDRIQAAADGTWKIQSNTGTGMDEMRSWTGVEHPDWASDLYDVNGDGLLDRITRDPNTNQWYVQANNNYPYLIHSANANKSDVLTAAGRFQFYARTLLPFVNVMENLALELPGSEKVLSPDKVCAGSKLAISYQLTAVSYNTKTLPDGRQFFYEAGVLVRIKDTEGKFTDVINEANGITVLKDVDGDRRFDASGNLVSITLPSGEKLAYSVERLADSVGKLTGRYGTYRLDANGQITGFTPFDPDWPETFTYTNGSLTKLVNARGEVLSFADSGQLTAVSLSSGETLSNFNLQRVPFSQSAVFGAPQEISVSTRNILETQSGGYTSSDLIDMNGDGILDRVTQSAGTRNYFEVEYGTGQGFLAPKPFTGLDNFGDAGNGWIRWNESGGIRVDLFDINGDGLPDRVVSDPYNYKNLETDSTKPPRYQETWHVQLNNGSGFNPAENWSFEIPGRVTGATKYPNMPAYKSHIRYYMAGDWTCSGNCNDPDQGVRAALTLTSDVNGDGLPDRVTQLQENDPMYVQLNNGHGFDAAVVWSDHEERYDRYVRYDWQTHFYTGDQSLYLDLRDINGDGIADRVFNPRGQNTFWMIEEGLASGGFSPMRSIQVPGLAPDYAGQDWTDSLGRTDVMDLMDINADGLADRIYQSWNDTRTFVQINNGKSFDPVMEWQNTPNLVLHPKSVTDWYSQNVTDTFIDVTGDRLPDKVWRDAVTGKWYVQENLTSPIADRIEVFRALQRTKQLEKSNFALEKLTNHQNGFSLSKLAADSRQLTALNNLSQYTLSPEAVAVSEYDESGQLLAVKKANGTTTLYDEVRSTNDEVRPLAVLNSFGELEIRYEYDSNGDPTRIKMETARRRLPLEIERAKQQVEAKRLEALLKLASQKAVAVRDIRTKVLSARLELEKALEELQKQQAYVSNLNTRGAKQIATIKANALAQINGALGTVYSTFTDIAKKEADAIAGVFSQVAAIKAQTDTDAAQAFAEIAAQQANIEHELVKQEISPVIYHWYRKILGRDPSKAEYDMWIAQTDFATVRIGSVDLYLAVKNFLSASAEKSEREAEVAAIKQELGARFMNLAPNLLSPAQKARILSWLASQDLHFGQSNWRSLEMLLQAAGKQFDRIDLVVKLVMADIEASVINAYDITQRDELQLSAYAMKTVAAEYGLNLNGFQLGTSALAAGALDEGDIVHVNNDHFVTIKTVSADKITYVDPSIGPNGKEDVIEITKDEFLKIWQGTVIAARAPPQNAQILTDRELQSIRGAGFFLFDIFKKIWKGFGSLLAGAINAIKSVVAGIIVGVKAYIQGGVSFVGNLLKGQFTEAFSGMFSGVTGLFGGVYGGLNNAFTDLTKGVQGYLNEVPFFGKTISKRLQYLTENGFSVQNVLVSIGFSPKVAATIVNSGKIAIGAAMLATGNPAGLGMIGDGTAGILQTNTHLSPYAIQGIRLGSQIAGGFVTGGPAGATGAFKSIFPQMAGTFASMGISQLGDKLGLDPRLMALMSVGANAIGSGFTSGIIKGGNPGTIFNSIKNSVFSGQTLGGLVGVGASIGLNKLGAPPIATNFVANFLGNVVSGFVGNNPPTGSTNPTQQGQSILSKIGDGIRKFGTGITNAAGTVIGFGAKVLSAAGQFTATAFKNTLSAAGRFFSPRTQEYIYQDVQGLRSGTVTENAGVWSWQSGGSRIDYNSTAGEMTESATGFGTTRVTGLGFTGNDSIYYTKLEYDESYLGGTIRQNYDQGALNSWSFTPEGGPSVTIDVPKQFNKPNYDIQGIPETGSLRVDIPAQLDMPWQTLIYFDFDDGDVKNVATQIIPSISAPVPAPQPPVKDLYVLVNGILNDKLSSSPKYLANYESDIVEQSNNKVGLDDIILAPTYFAFWALKLLNMLSKASMPFSVAKILTAQSVVAMAQMVFKSSVTSEMKRLITELANGTKDVVEFIKEVMDPKNASTIASEILQGLEGYFSGKSADEHSRPMVGVGYSAGFLPLAEILTNNPYDVVTQTGYNGKALVGLGAANFRLDEFSKNIVDKTTILAEIIKMAGNATADILDQIELALGDLSLTVGQLGNFALTNSFTANIMTLLRQGLIQNAYASFINEAGGWMDRLAADAPLDIRSSKIGVIVNVYGDKDVLATLDVLGEKVGGYRDDIGKYVVDDRNRPLVNVEILGANHFDYMRRADLSPTQSVGFGGSYGIGVTLANVLNTGNLGAYDGPLNFGKVLYDLTTEKDRKWNEAVSEFVARLTLNSKTSDDLDAFLRSLGPEIANFDNMQRKWVITLSGWEARK